VDRRLVAVLAIFLFMLGCILFPPNGKDGKPLVSAEFGSPPPLGSTCGGNATGDWDVAGTEECSDGVIILNGNLTIQPTGSLTLRNVTLLMNGTYNGERGIEVLGGGALYVYDNDGSRATAGDASNITANGIADPLTNVSAYYSFDFIVDEGASFEIKNSRLSYFGCTSGCRHYGLAIFADNTAIENNTIELVSLDSYGAAADSTVASAIYYNSSGNVFSNNNVSRGPVIGAKTGLEFWGTCAGNQVERNIFGESQDQGFQYAFVSAPGSEISNSNFTGNNATLASGHNAVLMQSSSLSNISFTGNSFNTSHGGFIFNFGNTNSSGMLISDNYIRTGGNAFYSSGIWESTRITGNNISSSAWGFMLASSNWTSTLLANNSIQMTAYGPAIVFGGSGYIGGDPVTYNTNSFDGLEISGNDLNGTDSNYILLGVSHANGLVIRDNRIGVGATGDAFKIYDSPGFVFEGNLAEMFFSSSSVSSKGLYVEECNDSNISGNTMFDMRNLVEINASSNITMENNALFTGAWALKVYGNQSQHFNHSINNATNNVNGDPLYYFYDIHDTTVENLDAGEIAFAYCDNITVRNNNISDGSGMQLFYRADYFEICNNSFTGFSPEGISIEVSYDPVIHDNLINGTWANGMGLGNTRNPFLYNNTISTDIVRSAPVAPYCGISLAYSMNATLRNNSMGMLGRYWESGLCVNINGETGGLYSNDISYFVHDIDTSNTVNNVSVQYFDGTYRACPAPGSTINVTNQTHYELVGCNRVTIDNSTFLNGDGLFLTMTNNSIVRRTNTSQSFAGVRFQYSTNNTAHSLRSDYDYQSAVIVQSSDSIINGSTMSNFLRAAVEIMDSTDCSASRLDITGIPTSQYGVKAISSNSALVYLNNVAGVGTGVRMDSCNGAGAYGNILSNTRTAGIVLSSCPDAVVSSNELSNASTVITGFGDTSRLEYGPAILVESSSDDSVVTDNQINGSLMYGITVQGSPRTEISWNTIRPSANPGGNAGIWVLSNGQDAQGANVNNNVVSDASRGLVISAAGGTYGSNAMNDSGVGIQLWSIACSAGQCAENNTISGNWIGSCSYGMWVTESGPGNSITRNSISDSPYGMGILFQYGNRDSNVSENELTANGYGIYLAGTDTNMTFSSNEITNSTYESVYLSSPSASGCNFSNNTILGGRTGILVNGASGNFFGNNTINRSGQSGIRAYSSSGNVFSGNSIYLSTSESVFCSACSDTFLANNITFAPAGGFRVIGSSGANLTNNTVRSTSSNASIYAESSSFLTMEGNNVSRGAYGIRTVNVTDSGISSNYVAVFTNSGIYLDNNSLGNNLLDNVACWSYLDVLDEDNNSFSSTTCDDSSPFGICDFVCPEPPIMPCEPPEQGEWLIYPVERIVCANRSIYLEGNLLDYGNLSYYNVSHLTNNSIYGYGITIYPGASFLIADNDGNSSTDDDASQIRAAGFFTITVSENASMAMENSKAGLALFSVSARDARFLNNTFNITSILLAGNGTRTVSGNTFLYTSTGYGSGYGVSVEGDSEGSAISNNTFLTPRFGVNLIHSSNQALSNNTFINCSEACLFINAADDYGAIFPEYVDNYVDTANTVDGDPIYYFNRCDNCSISGANLSAENVSNWGKIIIFNSTNVSISDSVLANNWNGDGIDAVLAENLGISNVSIDGGAWGIWLMLSDSPALSNSTVSGAQFALYFLNSSNATISGLNASGYDYGCHMMNSSNALISDSAFVRTNSSSWDICLAASPNNTALNTSVDRSWIGTEEYCAGGLIADGCAGIPTSCEAYASDVCSSHPDCSYSCYGPGCGGGGGGGGGTAAPYENDSISLAPVCSLLGWCRCGCFGTPLPCATYIDNGSCSNASGCHWADSTLNLSWHVRVRAGKTSGIWLENATVNLTDRFGGLLFTELTDASAYTGWHTVTEALLGLGGVEYNNHTISVYTEVDPLFPFNVTNTTTREALIDNVPPVVHGISFDPASPVNSTKFAMFVNATDDVQVDLVWAGINDTNISTWFNPFTGLYENLSIGPFPTGAYAVNATANDTSNNLAWNTATLNVQDGAAGMQNLTIDVNGRCIGYAINITVSSNSTPVANASVRVFNGATMVASNTTNSSGMISFITNLSGTNIAYAYRAGYEPAQPFMFDSGDCMCVNELGQYCANDTDCFCTGICNNNQCYCIDTGSACGSNINCCSGNCANGTCACAAPGNFCVSGNDCCSRNCVESICVQNPPQWSCTYDNDCYSGICSTINETCECPYVGAGCLNDSYCCGGCVNSSCACVPFGDPYCTRDSDCCLGVCSSAFDGLNYGWQRCTCFLPGTGCNNDSMCCAGHNCMNGTCVCVQVGDICSTQYGDERGDRDCCSGNCVAGTCLCTNISGRCARNSDCCNGACANNICVGTAGGGCIATGSSCSASSDCCSGYCDGGTCKQVCQDIGSSCSQGWECCSGNCQSGTCTCKFTSAVCSSGSECCSGACTNGFCACLDAGASCSYNSDCCTGSCSDGACACVQLGSSCSSDSACCEGDCVSGKCTIPCAPVGDACIAGSDCCSGRCLNRACAPECAAEGGPCTSDSGCCAGNCVSGACTSATGETGNDTGETGGETGGEPGGETGGTPGGGGAPGSGNATQPSLLCKAIDERCADNVECCSGNCIDKFCSNEKCKLLGSDCRNDTECCDQACIQGVCVLCQEVLASQNMSAGANGSARRCSQCKLTECLSSSQCCEGYCSNGQCTQSALGSATVFGLSVQSGCESSPELAALGICDFVWPTMIVLTLLAAIAARKEKNRLVPFAAFLLPIVLSWLTLSLIGTLAAIIEIVFFLVFRKPKQQ